VVVVAAVAVVMVVVVVVVIWRFYHRGTYLFHLSVGRMNLFHYPEGGSSRFLQKLASIRLHGVTYHTDAGILFLSMVY